MSRFTFFVVSLFFIATGALFAGQESISAKDFKKAVSLDVCVGGKDYSVELTIVSATVNASRVSVNYELVSKNHDLPGMDLVFEPMVGKAVLMTEVLSSPLKKGVKTSGTAVAETTKKLPNGSKVDKVRVSVQEYKAKTEKVNPPKKSGK